MCSEKAKHENRDMNIGALITIVIAGIMLVLIIFVGMIAWIQTEIAAIEKERRIEVENATLQSLNSEQLANITRQGKDTTGKELIPIEQAMLIVIQQHNKAQSASDRTHKND